MNRNITPACSTCSFLPPYIQRAIAQNGTPEQRARALRAMSVSTTMRTLRAAKRGQPAPSRSPDTSALAGVEMKRTIYDAHNQWELPGTVVRTEGQPAGNDAAVNEAYDGLGATFNLYWSVYDRNSIDGDGMPLLGVVHFSGDFANAFWDGQYMVFGDGDGDLFNRFTSAIDVMAHELTHGVTQDENDLEYVFQSGALNESISDVFGSLVKQRSLNQMAEQADWIIGAGLFTSKVNGVGIRSMKAPGTAYDDPVLGKDPQPGHMRNYVSTWEDNGGVHINSGIPNRAFYLAAAQIGGYAWEKAGRIWYETIRDPNIRTKTGFATFARRTVANAARLYGDTSPERNACYNAWREVGILLL
jgi:Zn-dependent metalloprotease